MPNSVGLPFELDENNQPRRPDLIPDPTAGPGGGIVPDDVLQRVGIAEPALGPQEVPSVPPTQPEPSASTPGGVIASPEFALSTPEQRGESLSLTTDAEGRPEPAREAPDPLAEPELDDDDPRKGESLDEATQKLIDSTLTEQAAKAAGVDPDQVKHAQEAGNRINDRVDQVARQINPHMSAFLDGAEDRAASISDQKKAATLAAGEATEEQRRAEAEMEAEKAEFIKQRMAEREALSQRMDKRVDDYIEKLNTMEVDPRRRWKNASTFGQIMGGFALFTGGFQAHRYGGRNLAAEQINKLVEQDIAAQQADINKQTRLIDIARGDRRERTNNFDQQTQLVHTERIARYASINKELEAMKVKATTQDELANIESTQQEVLQKIAQSKDALRKDAINEIARQQEMEFKQLQFQQSQRRRSFRGGGGSRGGSSSTQPLTGTHRERMLKQLGIKPGSKQEQNLVQIDLNKTDGFTDNDGSYFVAKNPKLANDAQNAVIGFSTLDKAVQTMKTSRFGLKDNFNLGKLSSEQKRVFVGAQQTAIQGLRMLHNLGAMSDTEAEKAEALIGGNPSELTWGEWRNAMNRLVNLQAGVVNGRLTAAAVVGTKINGVRATVLEEAKDPPKFGSSDERNQTLGNAKRLAESGDKNAQRDFGRFLMSVNEVPDLNTKLGREKGFKGMSASERKKHNFVANMRTGRFEAVPKGSATAKAFADQILYMDQNNLWAGSGQNREQALARLERRSDYGSLRSRVHDHVDSFFKKKLKEYRKGWVARNERQFAQPGQAEKFAKRQEEELLGIVAPVGSVEAMKKYSIPGLFPDGTKITMSEAKRIWERFEHNPYGNIAEIRDTYSRYK